MKQWIGILAIGILGIGLAAAQTQETTDLDAALAAINFRPIYDIIDTELLVSGFTNRGTATVPIETRIPVACTLVYGTTPAFGQLTLDQDMAGGTHSSHNPQLSGLEPKTLYYFRVQGVDNAGNISVSEMMTFTTPAFVAVETKNLLAAENGAEIMGVSSNWNSQDNEGRFGILSALDGDPSTAWSSDGDGSDAWVEVRLAQRSIIRQVEFWTRFMSDGTAQVFEFTVMTDSGDTYGPFTLPDPDQPYTFDVEFEAETLRFQVTDSSGGNTGAVEIAVYGEPAE
jgi:hypothetical protein